MALLRSQAASPSAPRRALLVALALALGLGLRYWNASSASLWLDDFDGGHRFSGAKAFDFFNEYL